VEQPEIETLVGDLETAVDRLRSLYEQYFMGFEKMEPQVPRKDVDRRIHVLRKEHFRNTALRFRFQMILQRYNTYQTHWQRILREIENGTYKRHVLRAERRFGDAPPRRKSEAPPRPASERPGAPRLQPGAALPAPGAALPMPGAALPLELAAELAELDREFDATPVASPVRPTPPPAAARAAQPPPAPLAARVPTPPQPPQPRPPPAVVPRQTAPAQPPPKPAEGIPEERVRQLYAQYVEAKRRQNESTAAITYEGVAKSLRDSSSKLQEKHGKKVDFEVTVKDGKTILKPVLK